MTEAIVARSITKRYGRLQALDDVSFVLPGGRVLGLLGPNGAGKTTLLRLLSGLIRADAGEIRVTDENVRGQTPKGLTALIDRPGYCPPLSARENLFELALAYGLDPASARASVNEALDRTGLSWAAQRRFGSFSTGMRQRLGLAGVLLGNPSVVLLDEPASGLDPAGIADVRSLVGSLRQAGTTVVVSSHLLGEMEQVCDEVLVLNRGKVVAAGPVRTLLAKRSHWEIRLQNAEDSDRARDALDVDYEVVPGREPLWLLATPRDDRNPRGPLPLLLSTSIVPIEVRESTSSLESLFFEVTE
jgi:ABC-2 type transport system ATP-binding protein